MYTEHTKTSVSVIFALPLDVNEMTKAAKMKINKFSNGPFNTLLTILYYAVIFVNYQSLWKLCQTILRRRSVVFIRLNNKHPTSLRSRMSRP